MKNLCCLFLVFVFLASCATKNMDSKKEHQLAAATQRLGEEYYNLGKYTAALIALLEAKKTIPKDPYLNNSLGLVYLAKKRYSLAENHFKTALKIKPDYINAKNNLGAAYLKQKKWDLAIECFNDVAQNILYATPEIPLSNLGWVYSHKKIYKQAKLYFKQALEINPDFLTAIHGISSIYIENKNYKQAFNLLHYHLKKQPRAAILHSDLAKAYESIGNFKQARRSWNLVLELLPATAPLALEAQKRVLQLETL
jgi:type IV pilus assembly protein PilF